jgi:GNAT superfamily N-acetyltransferase
MDGNFIRVMKAGDVVRVSAMIQESFHRFIARDYTAEGLKKFLEETNVEGISRILGEWPLLLVSEGRMGNERSAVSGMIGLRLRNHISLFFVDALWHGKGVGRLLLREAIQKTLQNNPDVTSITVNSSPFAVGFYEKMGFQRSGPERYMDGMLVNPMVFHP